jgi:hypothetical protein
MSLQQFSKLDKAQQRIYLLTQGTFLAERHTGMYDLMLYELDSFYVEAAFYKRTNKVAFFKTFDNTESLNPYLETINLDSLLQELSS